ncbi:MAG: NifB/NifX family molybdenum-iron cluster-binding protein [Armatimonadota bacterium]
MKAAVCSAGTTLDSPVDPRFGRCAYFVFVDTDTMEFTAEPNPGVTMGQGAGVAAAQVIASHGAQAVAAGNFGPNAFQALSAAGVKVYSCAAGTVRQAVEQLKAGALPEAGSATVAPHFGVGTQPAPGTGGGPAPGTGMGPGFGMGGGMGRGMGRGGGRGGGRGRGRW